MAENNDSLTVELYRDRGSTSRVIDACIDEKGQLVLSAQDIGELPRKMWGDSDYEFWVTVAREDKQAVYRALAESLDAEDRVPPEPFDAAADRALLQLVARKYSGVFGAVDDFREFANARGIEVRFESWT